MYQLLTNVKHKLLPKLLGTFLFAVFLFATAAEINAQTYYEFSLNQRRMGNQIGVEIWVRGTSATVPTLGNMSISVLYNNQFLVPSALVPGTNPSPQTDTIRYDMQLPTPDTTIISPYSLPGFGFSDLTAQAVDGNNGSGHIWVFQLDVNTNVIPPTGFKPQTAGRGTFVGMLMFDIINPGNITETTYTGIEFNPNTWLAAIAITDTAGNDRTLNSAFASFGNFTVRGITILNPNFPNQAVNRYPEAEFPILSLYPSLGYPIYFERSGLLTDVGLGDYGSNKFAYQLEYSLDNGSTWLPIGKVAEFDADVSGSPADYGDGEIAQLSFGGNDFFISQPDGSLLTLGYGGILRTVWEENENFKYRSEQARMRIRQIDTLGGGGAIALRNAYPLSLTTRWDINDYPFVLGRLFFVQLDGTNGYFKSARTYSNATRLTVEAWVNLNSITPGTSPAIVASSAGSVSPEEGAWMLYLHDGKYPAFRAREIEGRGPGGYIGTVISEYPLTATSDAYPITNTHTLNWVHIAAVVEDNVIKLYVNGEEAGRYINNNAVNIRMMTTNHPIWIGVNPNTYEYLHAGIKEVKVWRKALTQDELRTHVPGVYDPTNFLLGEERLALELYYPLQGSRPDRANELINQNDITEINYYNSPSIFAAPVNELINYRPDRAHVRLTSPTGGEGVSNIEDRTFEVRWVAYGLGSIAPSADDISIQYRRIGMTDWADAYDEALVPAPLNTVDIEAGSATWEPFNNDAINSLANDLQTILPLQANYAKAVELRISGTVAREQDDIYDVSGVFTVAPNFAYTNLGTAVVKVPENTALNLTNSNYLLEAWIRPYRFPTVAEGSFPIVSKALADGSDLQYALRLLPTGQLELEIASASGDARRIAVSSGHRDSVITKPNVFEYDTAWTHVAVYMQLTGQSTVIFYIDGTPQYLGNVTDQLGSGITVNTSLNYPVYLGHEPTGVGTGKSFIGEIKEIRFWNGFPGGQTLSSNVPNSDMTRFIQGALTVRAIELLPAAQTNLVAAYMLNGGSFVNNGIMRSIAAYPVNDNLNGIIRGNNYYYSATKPYLKVIEPTYKQRVANTTTDLKVRWVGFDYERNGGPLAFRDGSTGVHADLEYSIEGGGGVSLQPYQYVASQEYALAYNNTLILPTGDPIYEFPGTLALSQFAALLDVSEANPDVDGDQVYNDQGLITATNTNARLRLTGRVTINGQNVEYINGLNGVNGFMPTLRPESQLFTITPLSSFTVRVLLEGFHDGLTAGIQENIGTTAYDLNGNGLKIDLFSDNVNNPGNFIASGVSESGYVNNTTAFLSANRNGGDNSFANVPFVFDDLPDGRYFVKVSHINHLTAMSRYAAPFKFAGDDLDTWDIESGWDFQNWDGVAGNVLSAANALLDPPVITNTYTARGNSATDINLSAYATTALIFNDGTAGTITGDAIAAMVGGDVFRDGRINALDRAKVVADNGSTVVASDVTGDGIVNATDRQIVYRNNGKEEDPSLPVPADLPGSIKNTDIDIHAVQIANSVMHFSELAQMFVDSEKETANNSSARAVAQKYDDVFMSGAISYDMTAIPSFNNQYVDIAIYAKNTGGDFGFGNCTFGVKFENSKLQFVELINKENVIYNNRSDLGYFPTFTSPSPTAKDPISDARTLDINFDNYKLARKPGLGLPKSDTYLGTLRFLRLDVNDSYVFDWHNITVVYTVDGKNITANGNFKPIEPLFVNKPVTLTFPNGGENLAAGRAYTITWSKPSLEAPAYIDFSADNGATWTRLTAQPISLMAGSYSWSTPRINSNKCLIALVNANTGAVIDRSDATFSLTMALAVITRPASTDAVYKGGTNDFIRWEIDDNILVRFEFSENGTSNWIPVTPAVNSRNLQAPWILPMVNTKRAVIRMVNDATGEVIAVSQQFKILTGSLKITSPRGGEKLQAGVMKPIRWTFDNVSIFDLELSVDGGNTWTTVARNVNASARSQEWIVPNVNTKNAHIRALYNGDPELVYDMTPAFEIIGATDADLPSQYGLAISGITPNPFNAQAYVTFTIPNDMNVSVELYNAAGMKVMTVLNNEYLMKGANVVVVDGDGLTSGMYFVRINANGLSVVREIVYIK